MLDCFFAKKPNIGNIFKLHTTNYMCKSIYKRKYLVLLFIFFEMTVKQLLLFILMLFISYAAIAQENKIAERVYNTSRVIGAPPVIDGYADDDAWETVDWSGDFTQREPYEYESPSQQTAFKILFDDNNIYVAIRAFDTEPNKIEKRLSRRDGYEGDWVAISFDSYDDKLTGFSFAATASGVKGDVIITNDNQLDDTWNPVWYLKVSVDELGWVAEMKIPLTQLRFAKVEDYVWGLEVMRQLFRKEEFSVWQMVPQDASGWVSMWGELVGINNIKPKKEIELVPYVMGSLQKSEKIDGDPFTTGTDWGYNAGLDGKIAVTNDFTLNFTINPDFGQVEADPSEVNLSAFESYFPEKRPFFIEGSNIFNFPLSGDQGRENLFYSRRIGGKPHFDLELEEDEYARVSEFTRILAAFKLSGKTKNGWSIGVMESVTNEAMATIDSLGIQRKEAVEPITNFFNIRVQKDINGGNTIIGGMVTATNRFISDSTLSFLPSSAYTGGIDFTNYWDDRNYYLRAKILGSNVNGDSTSIIYLQEAPQRYYQRPDNELSLDSSLISLSGYSGSVNIGKDGGGHWRYGFNGTWLSPGFAINDMGYMRRADAINNSAWVNYVIWTPFSIFRNINYSVMEWAGWDFSGRHLYTGLRFAVDAQFSNYWGSNIGLRWEGVDVNRAELRGGPALLYPGNLKTWLSVESDSRKKLVLEISGSVEVGKNNNKLHQDIDMEISYRPFNALQMSLTPQFTIDYDKTKYVETIVDDSGDRYVVGALVRHITSMDIRINYSITPDLSLQYWGQPFFYSADYLRFAEVVDAGNFNISKQYHVFTDDEISYNETDDTYEVIENGQSSFSFENPDFSVFEFRSNFVIRWEYIPGSTIYAVWSQGRSGYDEIGIFDFNNNVNKLVNIQSSNIFLLKFSYRISI
jgi:hypothetical protein